jgi:hypothetical protein
MNEAWTDIHWRGLAAAVVAIGVVAVARAGGGEAHCVPPLERAQVSLRATDWAAPSSSWATGSWAAAADLVTAGHSDKPMVACTAQSAAHWDRDAQRTLASTITMTTTNIIDRNPSHAVTLAFARP